MRAKFPIAKKPPEQGVKGPPGDRAAPFDPDLVFRPQRDRM